LKTSNTLELNLMSIQDLFIESAASYGLHITHLVEGCGLQRVPVCGDKSGKKSGAYSFHSDGIPAGFIENFRTGQRTTWRSKESSRMSQEQHHKYLASVRANQALKKNTIKVKQAAAAATCQQLWNCLPVASNSHPYLVRKGVKAHGLRLLDELLVVPLRNCTGELRSWQTIDNNGRKMNQIHGEKKSHYHSIGRPRGLIYVCEGYATGASIYELTGHAVAVALDAYNLHSVAKELKVQYQTQEIIIAADNDHRKDSNVGLIKGRSAAVDLDLSLVYPAFEIHQSGSDFNDMARLSPDRTKDCLKRSEKT